MEKPNILSSLLDKQFDAIEHKLSMISGSSVDFFTSTGIYAFDIITGGGIRPGFYIVSGKEQSAKSTACWKVLKKSIQIQIPAIVFYNAENALSEEYVSRMLEIPDITDVFGVSDRKGWIKQPLIRYYTNNIVEDIFMHAIKVLDSLPDKRFIIDGDTVQWYYVFSREKEEVDLMKRMQANGLAAHDKNLYQTKGQYWCPTDDTNPIQAVFILDSFPSLVSKKEDESGQASNAMADAARNFAKWLPKVKGKLKHKRAVFYGVNQIRERPGVSFGCFHYNSQVRLSNGKNEYIGKIVNQRLPVEVMSYNMKTKQFEPKKVVNWFNNGESNAGEFYTMSIKTDGLRHTQKMYVTKNHKILRYGHKNMEPMSSFKEGDFLTSYKKYRPFNPDQMQFLYGSLLGDGCLSRAAGDNFKLQFNHSSDQFNYLKWKAKILKGFVTNGRIKPNDTTYVFVTKVLRDPYFKTLYDQYSKDLGYRSYSGVPDDVVKFGNEKAIAIWFMDDGSGRYKPSFFVSRLDEQDKKRLCDWLFKVLNLKFKYTKEEIMLDDYRDKHEFFDKIGKYMFREFAYKIEKMNVSVKPYYFSYKWDNTLSDEVTGATPALITKIQESSGLTFSKSKNKYDLEIEGNHTYLVADCVVHNSPEYEAGGNALAFYSDVRNKLTPVKNGPSSFDVIEPSVFGKGQDEYQWKKIKSIKNKEGSPFGEELFLRIWVKDYQGNGHGIDPVFDVYQYLEVTGQIAINGRGKTRKIKINIKPFDRLDLTYHEFKEMILAYKSKTLRLAFKEKHKQPWKDIRPVIEDQLENSLYLDMIYSKEKPKKENQFLDDYKETDE
jgi:recombination protein RecA